MNQPSESLRAPKGTNDILPPVSWRWQRVMRLGMDIAARAGYAPVETPAFEHTEVFERGVGTASEVVGKQMYTFEDRGGRSLTLRPEGTAPVMRAVLEHNLGRGSLPVKLAYAGAMYRQERPQKGRYRQFFQIGIEAIGSDDPLIDAEVIQLSLDIVVAAGVRPALLLNSIGHPGPGCRGGYVEQLASFLAAEAGALAPSDRGRAEANPLRTFDSKEPATLAAMKRAPLIDSFLCDACREHFAEVCSLLEGNGVEVAVEPRLVRGLDYYTRTTFELVAANLGAQDAVGGGGRYDGLSESLGGPPLPGIGFALGVDRMVLSATGAPELFAPVRVYFVVLEPAARAPAFKAVSALRGRGIGADLDFMGRSMKGQLKDADRSGARWAVIVGPDEMAAGTATVKDLGTGEQERVSLEGLTEEVARRAAAERSPAP